MLERRKISSAIPLEVRLDIESAQESAREAVAEHLAAGRSVYFCDDAGVVYERTPSGEVYHVKRENGEMARVARRPDLEDDGAF